MKRYVGIDVAQKDRALCVVDVAGTILFEGVCATAPDVILQMIGTVTDNVEKIVHESGPLSIWLTRELVKRGAPVICIDARAAHKVLSARMNKSDRSDAVGLAQLARTGWYGAVHVKSEASDQLRVLLAARDRLIRIRMGIEGQVRGLLKRFAFYLSHLDRKLRSTTGRGSELRFKSNAKRSKGLWDPTRAGQCGLQPEELPRPTGGDDQRGSTLGDDLCIIDGRA